MMNPSLIVEAFVVGGPVARVIIFEKNEEGIKRIEWIAEADANDKRGVNWLIRTAIKEIGSHTGELILENQNIDFGRTQSIVGKLQKTIAQVVAEKVRENA